MLSGMRRRAPLLVAAVAIIAGGCSSDDGDSADTTDHSAETTAESPAVTSPETSASIEAPPAVCGPLRVISDYDTRTAELIATAQDFTVLRDYLVANGPAILGGYDEVAELEPTLAEDAAILAEITDATLDAAADAQSLPELSSVLLSNPDVEEAGLAGERLDAFAERECGFSTGSN
jgi:hypothetical protein